MPYFTREEKARIRYHLGYVNVTSQATFALGLPAGVEPIYLIEAAMDRVLPEAVVIVRDLMSKCDLAEAQMVENQELLAVTQVDEIGIRQDEFQRLQDRYLYWRSAMANNLGVQPNPWDRRFVGGHGRSINVSVTG